MRDADLEGILLGADQSPFTEQFELEANGMAHPILVAGEGPAVLLMHELPGFLPEYWRLARWIEAAGFRVYAPALFDRPDTPLEQLVKAHGRIGGMARACISREIRLFARTGGSPVSDWLRALARRAHAECGGPGIGAVGLCMTGNFAWSVAVDPCVLASVAGEPALPFTSAGGLHLSLDEADALRQRERLSMMALRFSGDPSCRAERFAALSELVGDRLDARVLPDAAQNPDGNPFPHAVLTKDLIAQRGEPTFEAARDVLSFLRARLIED